MRKLPYLDLRQHWREWHQAVLPLFVLIAAVLMVFLLVTRPGAKNPAAADLRVPVAPIGLIAAHDDSFFDPAFALASPIEMVLAPVADRFEFPTGSRNGALALQNLGGEIQDPEDGVGRMESTGESTPGDSVYAVSDGLVFHAGRAPDGLGHVLVLLHERPGGEVVQTLYGRLATMRVPVGKQVRRGEVIGTMESANGSPPPPLRFEVRRFPSLDIGERNGDGIQGLLPVEETLKQWRGRAGSLLYSAPAGEPLEPTAFQLEVEGPG